MCKTKLTAELVKKYEDTVKMLEEKLAENKIILAAYIWKHEAYRKCIMPGDEGVPLGASFIYEEENDVMLWDGSTRPARAIVELPYCVIEGRIDLSYNGLEDDGIFALPDYPADFIWQLLTEDTVSEVLVRADMFGSYRESEGACLQEIMADIVWDGIEGRPSCETAKKRLMNMSLEEFASYDPTTDCISPLTGKKIVDDFDTTMERFEKFRNNEIDFDADMSLEACLIAKKVFPFVYSDGIFKHNIHTVLSVRKGRFNRYCLKYELGGRRTRIAYDKEDDFDAEIGFSGDVMNSVWTTISEYKNIFKCGEAELPKEALDLIDVYHTMGNFMMIPSKLPSVNMARGTFKGKSRDYFDLYLLAIYNFYQKKCGKETVGNWDIEDVLGECSKFKHFIDFLESFKKNEAPIPDWNTFVKENYFQDFVERKENGYGMPKELWTGHFKCVPGENVKPLTKEQFTEFFVNAAQCIKCRSVRIYEAMKKEK